MTGKTQHSLTTTRAVLIFIIGIAPTAWICGCGDAPSFDILGSYFPAWLVCILIGIAVSSATGLCLSAGNRQKLIRWSIVTYPCLAASIAFTLWLLFYS
jgi:hypothetical protein